MAEKPIIPETDDHPAIYRDGHRLTANPPAASVPPEPPTLSEDIGYATCPVCCERAAVSWAQLLRFGLRDFPLGCGHIVDKSVVPALMRIDQLENVVEALRAELADARADAERSDALHRRRYENIATALGRRYPTAEEIVAAAITFIDTARAASGEDTSR